MVERVAIVGVGLIGGSLAMAWKERRPDLTITGWDRPDVLASAQERGIVDEVAPSLKDTVVQADVVVLATPLATIEALIQALAGWLRPNTIVTDVGSVKTPILAAVQQHWRTDQVFIGGPSHGGLRTGRPSQC